MYSVAERGDVLCFGVSLVLLVLCSRFDEYMFQSMSGTFRGVIVKSLDNVL